MGRRKDLHDRTTELGLSLGGTCQRRRTSEVWRVWRTESPRWRAIFLKGMLSRDSGPEALYGGGADAAESALEALE